jgi:hypothetical protein
MAQYSRKLSTGEICPYCSKTFDTYYNICIKSYYYRNPTLLYIMKNKSVLAIFVVALAAVVSGVFYFGGALNQQASVANLIDRTKPVATLPPVSEPIDPVVLPVLPKNELAEMRWKKLCLDQKSHIQVLSPNGGEVFAPGQKIPVTWRSCNLDSKTGIWIDLIHTANDPSGREWGFSTKNDGYELVNPPANYGAYTAGKYYKVLVYPHDSTSSLVRDRSDNTFTINTTSLLDIHYVSSNATVTQNSSGSNNQATFSISF